MIKITSTTTGTELWENLPHEELYEDTDFYDSIFFVSLEDDDDYGGFTQFFTVGMNNVEGQGLTAVKVLTNYDVIDFMPQSVPDEHPQYKAFWGDMLYPQNWFRLLSHRYRFGIKDRTEIVLQKKDTK